MSEQPKVNEFPLQPESLKPPVKPNLLKEFINKHIKNPQAWFISGLILIVVGGLAWQLYPRSKAPMTVVITSCSSGAGISLLQQAQPLINSSKGEELKPVADKILAIKNYQADPNCLYVLTNYYLNLSDAAKARQTLDQLKKVYKPANGYSSFLGSNTLAPDQLESSVSFLEKQAAQSKTYLFGANQP